VTLEPGADLVLRSLRVAPLRCSVDQLAADTGFTEATVEAHLVSLRLAGLACIWTRDWKRGGQNRSPLVLWQATAPDPM
jgi:predicted ArsR family transcriptional regulator